MKKAVFLSAAALAVLGSRAFAAEVPFAGVAECQASGLATSLNDACHYRGPSGSSGSIREIDDSGQDLDSGERQPGASGPGGNEADENDESESEQPGLDDNGDDHAQDDRDGGGSEGDQSAESRDRSADDRDRPWGGQDQSGNEGLPSDGYGDAPDAPPQGDDGDGFDSDDASGA